MRVFVIHDDEIDKNGIGYLFHYERSNKFIVEIKDNLNEWNAPLLFSALVKRGIYTIPQNISRLWIEERVIPSGRQNIGMILKNAKLKKYNEGRLLALSKGKSSQDSCYIREIKEDEIPEWVKKRQADNIIEAFPIEDNRIVCMLNNDTTIEVNLKNCLEEVPKLYSILSKDRLLSTLKVDAGGYGVTFNETISIDKRILLEHGVILPIYAHVFQDFVRHSIVNTTETCSILECTRQNLAHLIKTDVLHPLKEGWRENMFLKGEVTSGD